MSDLPNKQCIEKLAWPIENIVNVLTLCKNYIQSMRICLI